MSSPDRIFIPRFDDAKEQVLGVIKTSPFAVSFRPGSAHRWRFLANASAITGACTVSVDEVYEFFDGAGDLATETIAGVYPEDVNSDAPIAIPDIVATNTPITKVFDRFISAQPPAEINQPPKLVFTFTPGTDITLDVLAFQPISYGG
ncbi:MAG: hypothetical protein ACE5NA_00085 [Nitrospiraceae bacterium]